MAQEKDTLDFIVIGAQKAGTTSLYHYLRPHPEICLPAAKEAPYFSHDPAVQASGWPTYIRKLGREGFGERADPARRWGTVTPQYMAGGVFQAVGEQATRGYDERTVPMRIRERLPDVRLVGILRDPVERAISHHRMRVRVGEERRSFDTAIEQLLRPDALERARRTPREKTGYIAWGEYARILGGYLEVFPREQLLVVFTADLERDPARVLRAIHEFIGVSPDFEAENLGQRFHVGTGGASFSWTRPASWTGAPSPVSPQGIGRALRRSSALRAAWHALPDSPQRGLARRYKRAARRALLRSDRAAATTPSAEAPPSDATLERLREHYAGEAGRLVALLGAQELPWSPPEGDV